MESNQVKNRKRDREGAEGDDQEMQSTTTDDQAQGPRKIVKAKRRADKNNGAMIDPETGEEIEFEDDSDDMDDQCIDEQDVIHPENDDWEDEEE
jgi:hypothetical protein|tara:strand:- start:1869 stop:2150 length:282 start_codon:yes stop_codon:yes gene_type:complete